MEPGVWRTSARAANLRVVRLHLRVAGLHAGLRGKSGDPAVFESSIHAEPRSALHIPHPKKEEKSGPSNLVLCTLTGQHPDFEPQKKKVSHNRESVACMFPR